MFFRFKKNAKTKKKTRPRNISFGREYLIMGDLSVTCAAFFFFFLKVEFLAYCLQTSVENFKHVFKCTIQILRL